MTRWGGILFFGIFAACGLFVGFAAVRALVEPLRMRGWQATPATIIDLRVSEGRGSESTSYWLEGQFRYLFGSREFVGNRIESAGWKSNDSCDQNDRRDAFLAASESETLVAYVNPSDPSEAILNRAVPVGQVALSLIIVLSHGTIGLAGIGCLIGAAAPKRLGDRFRIVSTGRGMRWASISVAFLHVGTLAIALTLMVIGAVERNWVALIPLLLACVSGAILWFCERFWRKHVGRGTLDVPLTQGSEFVLRVPHAVDREVNLDARWSVSIDDSDSKDSPAWIGDVVSIHQTDHGDGVRFMPPSLPPAARRGERMPLLLDLIGTIDGRGYEDSFAISGDALEQVLGWPD